MRAVLIFFAALITITVIGGINEKNAVRNDNLKRYQNFDRDLITKMKLAVDNLPSEITSNKYQQGVSTFVVDKQNLTEQAVQKYLNNHKEYKNNKSASLTWFDSNKNSATMTTMGTDWQHHFVNSYLVGIRPFVVENPWLPLYVISKTKTYQLDSEQYNTPELWQNSAQAFKQPRGDCEDHALALADWLISEGVDAKVVIGKYKQGGHAWVIAERNNRTYLLEATAKRVRKNWNHYPLASLSQHYYPKLMFNRNEFWENTGTTATKDYQGLHWEKRSTFSRTYNRTFSPTKI